MDRVSYNDYYENNDDRYYIINKKPKLTDYIKLGFGFYIGYNAAHLLFTSVSVLINYKNQKK